MYDVNQLWNIPEDWSVFSHVYGRTLSYWCFSADAPLALPAPGDILIFWCETEHVIGREMYRQRYLNLIIRTNPSQNDKPWLNGVSGGEHDSSVLPQGEKQNVPPSMLAG